MVKSDVALHSCCLLMHYCNLTHSFVFIFIRVCSPAILLLLASACRNYLCLQVTVSMAVGKNEEVVIWITFHLCWGALQVKPLNTKFLVLFPFLTSLSLVPSGLLSLFPRHTLDASAYLLFHLLCYAVFLSPVSLLCSACALPPPLLEFARKK